MEAIELEAEMGYTVQVHGEWSGREDVADVDFDADTLEEARAIVATEVPAGVIYEVYDPEWRLVMEGTR